MAAVDVIRRLVQKSREADGDLLLERLRIRLGKDAVYGIETAADHRPETPGPYASNRDLTPLLGNLVTHSRDFH